MNMQTEHTPGGADGWRDRLRDKYRASKTTNAQAFWSEFRDRAHGLPRLAPADNRTHRGMRMQPLAIAAAAVLVLGLAFWQARGPSRPAAPGTILSASSDAAPFLVWHDAEGRGTIVWLLAEDTAGETGG